AGFSGVCAAVQLKEQLGITDFVVFELLPDLGGTWLANSYPGAACDVPSHMYSYSFNLNPDWSEKYSSQREIFQYIKDTAAKFDVYKNIRFNTAVLKVEWSAKDGHWLVHTQRQQTSHHPTQPVELHTFDIVFSGIGALRVPAKPAIFDAFQGEKMHSAEWNHAVDLANKTVAVVGTGASAIQIIPSIQPRVRELITFQRTPTWIMPRNSNKYSDLIKMLFRFVPVVQWLYRCYLYLLSEFMLLAFFKNSLVSYIAPLLGKLHLRRQIGDKALRDKLLPRYPLGCKRVVVS
ncbi:FAD/NAD(P)-binding domain-containing protein, partial [Ramicandelaber brevisporus]